MKISVISILVIGLTALLVVSLPMAVMAEGLLYDKAFTTLLDGDNDVLTVQDGMFQPQAATGSFFELIHLRASSRA